MAARSKSARRLRWLVLVGLAGVAVWVVRSRRAGPAGLLEQWPDTSERSSTGPGPGPRPRAIPMQPGTSRCGRDARRPRRRVSPARGRASRSPGRPAAGGHSGRRAHGIAVPTAADAPDPDASAVRAGRLCRAGRRGRVGGGAEHAAGAGRHHRGPRARDRPRPGGTADRREPAVHPAPLERRRTRGCRHPPPGPPRARARARPPRRSWSSAPARPRRCPTGRRRARSTRSRATRARCCSTVRTARTTTGPRPRSGSAPRPTPAPPGSPSTPGTAEGLMTRSARRS